jgi:hypothetical protein
MRLACSGLRERGFGIGASRLFRDGIEHQRERRDGCDAGTAVIRFRILYAGADELGEEFNESSR